MDILTKMYLTSEVSITMVSQHELNALKGDKNTYCYIASFIFKHKSKSESLKLCKIGESGHIHLRLSTLLSELRRSKTHEVAFASYLLIHQTNVFTSMEKESHAMLKDERVDIKRLIGTFCYGHTEFFQTSSGSVLKSVRELLHLPVHQPQP